MTTRTSLQREGERTIVDLRAAAQATADDAAAIIPESTQFLAAMVADPNLNAFDAARCETALSALSAFAQQANVFVIDPNGARVCQLNHRSDAPVMPAGDWLARTRAGQPFATSVSLDATSGRPLVNLAVPVQGPSGVGALVTTWDAAAYGLEVPKNVSARIELVELDAKRSIVIAASPKAPVKAGALPTDSWMRGAVGNESLRVDDGVERYWQEASVRGLDRVVLAGIPKSVALEEAHNELRRNVVVGAAVMFLVITLGVLVERRIAKPIETLTTVIAAAAEAEDEITAVPDGPSELAALARAFNDTMGERRQLERDLAHALKDAQQASKLKSEFLANMSHEIRTPMNGVLGMLSVLEDADVSPDVRDGLRTMGESAESLMTILNELLDFSKLEAGVLATESLPFNLREVIHGAISPWVVIAGRKDVPLTAEVAADVPETVIGDPTRVRQILSNLIDNAVKFTSSGRVTVTAVRATGDLVRFEVADSGIGISDDGRTHLFEPFVQADGTTTRLYGGTGLGLAICRQLAQFMGGGIGVDSTLGEGSTFWFELPLPVGDKAASHPEPDLEGPATPTPAPAPNLRLLVVDDNVVNQKVAVQMLRKLDYDVDVVGNGAEALRAVEGAGYDAVLMDVQMPVMDGLTATVELRRRGVTLPIVAMTAHAHKEDRQRCLRAGMDGYVVKPMSVESLSTELSQVLTSARAAVSTATAR